MSDVDVAELARRLELLERDKPPRPIGLPIIAPPAPDTTAGKIAAAQERRRLERLEAAEAREAELRAERALAEAEARARREAVVPEIERLEAELAELREQMAPVAAVFEPLYHEIALREARVRDLRRSVAH